MRLYFIEVRIYYLVLLLGYILLLDYYFHGEKLNKVNNIRKYIKWRFLIWYYKRIEFINYHNFKYNLLEL